MNAHNKNKQQQQSKRKMTRELLTLPLEASTFMTFKQVNNIRYTGLSETKVLLDNQADISIMKPSLLHALAPAEKTVKVDGVGRLQLQ